MERIYWDSKKQTGVLINDAPRYVSLGVDLDAWNEEREGDGAGFHLEQIIYYSSEELDDETKRILWHLQETTHTKNWTKDRDIERLFDKYEFRFWMDD